MTELNFLSIAQKIQGLHPRASRYPTRPRSPDIDTAWQRWLRFGGGGDWRVLKKRMRAEGLRPSSLFTNAPEDAATTPWLTTLVQVQAQAQQTQNPNLTSLPLGALLSPFMSVGLMRFKSLQPGHAKRITSSALQDLQVALLKRLETTAAASIVKLFAEQNPAPSNAVGASLLGMLMGTAAAPTGKFNAFVSQQLANGYADIAARWPVLLRLLCRMTEHWAEASAEFAERLATDHAGLCEKLNMNPSSQVSSLHATLSDPHAGGRAVIQVTFSDGSMVAYKPRPIDMEAGFSDALTWLNAQLANANPLDAPTESHLVPWVWTRGDYGWMQWVSPAAMQAGSEPHYHWRLGSVIALYRALGGIDLHIENAVAHGEFPALVDVECLLHPGAHLTATVQAISDQKAESDSVDADSATALINIGALPFYAFDAQGDAYSYGLFGNGLPQTGPQQWALRHPDTDWIAMHQVTQAVATAQLPATPEGLVNSLLYAGDAARGYQQTLALVLEHREALLATGGALAQLQNGRGRHLARTSSHYGSLLKESMQPLAMQNGVLFDLTFEPLHRHMASLPLAYQLMAPAERRDLRDLDVPRFMFQANSLDVLDARGHSLGKGYNCTPWEHMAASLRAIGTEQPAWEASVLSHCLKPTPTASSSLTDTTLKAPSGRVLWFSLSSGEDGLRTRPASAGLYNGSSGIALALAAAGQAGQGAKYLELAHTTLQQSCRELLRFWNNDTEPPQADTQAALLERLGLGLDNGLAGLLFALNAAHDLLPDAHELHNESWQLATGLVGSPAFEELIKTDKRLDLLGGVAGLGLVLLAWHTRYAKTQTHQAEVFVKAAKACGQRVLRLAQRAQLPDGEHLSWPLHGSVGLSGLSHGGSGFALLFSGLYQATREQQHLSTVLAALRHEATLYDTTRLNWRDMRDYKGSPADSEAIGQVRYFGRSWCHGAPGVALARAKLLASIGDALDVVSRERLEKEQSTAMQTLQATLALDDAQSLGDLCCGMAGRLDILLECGRLANRADWTAIALEAGQRWLAAHQQKPNLWFADLPLAGSDLGLFKGLAVLPYIQGRLAAPTVVPCVLLP